MSAGTINVIGIPQPQGNKTGYPFRRRDGSMGVAMVEGKTKAARERFTGWREAVASAARDWSGKSRALPYDGPLFFWIAFYMPRPKSLAKRVLYPATRPDGEKLVRAVFDALTGIVFTNDARVVKCNYEKAFATTRAPGALINWKPL